MWSGWRGARSGGEARWGVALATRDGATLVVAVGGGGAGTPGRLTAAVGTPGENGGNAAMQPSKTGMASHWAAVFRRGHRRIREKVIGHGWCARTAQVVAMQSAGALHGAFALLHEPAREHGGGIFFQPLIQQGAHLLAEIGSVRQAGELVALQGVLGSRKQELPRGLSRVTGQGGPPDSFRKNNRKVIHVKDDDRISTVESCGKRRGGAGDLSLRALRASTKGRGN